MKLLLAFFLILCASVQNTSGSSKCANGYPDRCEQACGCPIYSIDSAYIKAHDKEFWDRNHDSERNLLSNLTWPEDSCIPFRVKCRNPDVWGWTDWTYIMENNKVNWNLLTKDIRIMDRKCDTKTGRWSNVKENGDLEGMHYTCVTVWFDETKDLNRH
ncbi:hypothetical protein B9Z55_002808 [Caenorhabditis nigoni]|uniref:C-type lectin domain-containing protein n=1 Tax=Caenorhabditis nigoni TaxID=1611254 RepID=A0A2G5VM95_9PELO|nr:hypothetical protein B9Z55_002808 [Caenorhabditis nigoni]